MGRTGARRSEAFRVSDPGRRAGRLELAHHSEAPRGLPQSLCRFFIPNASRAFRQKMSGGCCRTSASSAIGSRLRVPSKTRGVSWPYRRGSGALTTTSRRFTDGRTLRAPGPITRGTIRATRGIGRPLQRSEKARFQFRGLHDHVRSHAGVRTGKRPRRSLFQRRRRR